MAPTETYQLLERSSRADDEDGDHLGLPAASAGETEQATRLEVEAAGGVSELRRGLGSWDAMAIVVSVIVGAGNLCEPRRCARQ